MKGLNPMSRMGEVVLSVISAFMTLLGIVLVTVIVVGGSNVLNDETFTAEFHNILANDPTLTEADRQVMGDVDLIADLFGIFGWVFIIVLVISLILNVIGIVSISKNKSPKLAGVMFIIAGVFAGIISLTSILLYIAAIMCFVRKPPVQFAEQEEYYSPEKTL